MLSPLAPITLAILLAAVAGIPLLLSRASATAQRFGAGLQLLASACGLAGALMALSRGESETWQLSWGLPFGPAEVGIDPLSAFFLIPIFLVSGCAAVYAVGYWPAPAQSGTAPRLALFFGILTAALAAIVIARHGVLFLIVWEFMALSCYFLMTAEHRKKEVREAGTLYLITTHLGTLALFALFSLLAARTGSFAFPSAGSLSGGGTAIFIAALLGFGLKAGLVPLHVWLPSAHANAPSHVSAVMSGVLIKMGVYGLIRTTSFFTDLPFWWGIVILLGGVVSGIIGVVFAIGQHDIKRLLAYHSIENIGIIAMGLGMALMGRSSDIPALTLLGLAGALLHTLNHALFKSLLFLGAGSVIHACGTREIDRMGGLGKNMPWTALFFLTGAVAICGLPPLNGFVSEWLIYLGMFRGILDHDTLNDPFFALAAPALALVGSLAVACFVKVFGTAFLGAPRTEAAATVHEAGPAMLAPMGVLAGCCLLIGLFPHLLARTLELAAGAAAPGLVTSGLRLADHASLTMVSLMAVLLVLLLGVVALLYRRRLGTSPVTTAETWGCGYLAPTPRMQYTSSSFAAMLVSLFGGLLRPHVRQPVIDSHFPRVATFRSHIPEAVLDLVFLPALRSADERLSLLRKLQNGKLPLYILYIVVTLVVLMVWSHFTVGR
jgi:hydrogenase-4 component B